jgi:hypothetical protein
MLYAMHPTDHAGAVTETGVNLAALVGMSPTVFCRTRRQVIEAGWLEESDRLAHISYHRISPKTTGEDVADPLRRATRAASSAGAQARQPVREPLRGAGRPGVRPARAHQLRQAQPTGEEVVASLRRIPEQLQELGLMYVRKAPGQIRETPYRPPPRAAR